MLFSIYPTDAAETRRTVIDQVLATAPSSSPAPGASGGSGDERMLFTSLHMVDTGELAAFGEVLRAAHDDDGVTFCADVSPVALEYVVAGDEGWGWLARRGITMLRLDYGFDADEIDRVAEASGCRIAVNASTVDVAFLDELAGLPVVGWHNFYPRPETGLTASFLVAQSRLFLDRGMPVLAFIPGERELRAPLHLGLPTLEEQRHHNAWRSYLQLRRLVPEAVVVCAEGAVADDHAAWIAEFEATGTVTLPVVGLDAAASVLLERPWRLRVEEAAASFRLDETRGSIRPSRIRNADARERGSLQVDLDAYGRYRGEVHLMRADRPLDAGQARIGEVAAPYRGIVDDLRPGQTVRLIPLPA
ncbi:MupG family TIM beta-alpha barrel fold protein [Microbacterium plantarum]|uniref:MupG family TIM beta-alpha barrel fold protein n=1 Tax=Microbacterium plantarum TaxID=1816425 RepID=UPI002B490ADC|nr:MupG family TIM beta-alpha barrel fold protein [Microbacterium plantarum]WRK17255.1 MupG family TIM beta-alpha barrel fold protein [Microbacterium plantarum]